MKATEKNYASIADRLVIRFKNVIREHPEMINETDPFAFFDKGLKVNDLKPSLFQATWAMRKAISESKESKP